MKYAGTHLDFRYCPYCRCLLNLNYHYLHHPVSSCLMSDIAFALPSLTLREASEVEPGAPDEPPPR